MDGRQIGGGEQAVSPYVMSLLTLVIFVALGTANTKGGRHRPFLENPCVWLAVWPCATQIKAVHGNL
jgi:hypothetical protein